MTVTVKKTITEHTNGRRLNKETGQWERRVGTRRLSDEPTRRGRYPRMETIWEPCEGPKTYDYGSPEHLAQRERGKGGGDIKYVIEGLPSSLETTLLADEVEDLFRSYVHKFSRMTYIADGGRLLSTTCEATASEAMREARRIAKRVEDLFGVDLWATNVSKC